MPTDPLPDTEFITSKMEAPAKLAKLAPPVAFAFEGVLTEVPTATCSVVGVKCIVEMSDERVAKLVKGGRYTVTLARIED